MIYLNHHTIYLKRQFIPFGFVGITVSDHIINRIGAQHIARWCGKAHTVQPVQYGKVAFQNGIIFFIICIGMITDMV
ncbi:hypothetical protein D3C80_1450650 [compost metagenome]